MKMNSLSGTSMMFRADETAGDLFRRLCNAPFEMHVSPDKSEKFLFGETVELQVPPSELCEVRYIYMYI